MSHLAALGQVSELWLNHRDSFRANALAALQVSTGYSVEMLDYALDAVFSEITLSKLQVYSLSSPLKPPLKKLTVLHVAAGNVFTAWLHGVVISLLLGHRVRIKPSSGERVFPALWHQSVQRIDTLAAEAIAIVDWNESVLKEADIIVAYGADETLKAIHEKIGSKPFIGYGHKISAAIIFAEAGSSDTEVLQALWRDIDTFDLQGCLSPQVVYVEGNAHKFEEVFRKRKPSGPLPRWKAFKRLDSVWNDLAPVQKHLSCLGVAGSEAQLADVRMHYQNNPAIRICPVGDMQRPPLAWLNGGIDLRQSIEKNS